LTRTCFFAWAISGGSFTGVVACASTAAHAAAPAAAPAGPNPVWPDCASAGLGGERVSRLERLLRLFLRRLRLRLLLLRDDLELLDEEDFELFRDLDRLLLLRDLLFERFFFDFLDFTDRWLLLLRLLLELFREDLLLERLEEEEPDLAEVEASESRNFLGFGLPRVRRSLLP